MRFLAFFLLGFLAVSMPARAQDNAIKVIQDDGSVAVIKLWPKDAPEADKDKPVQPAQKQEKKESSGVKVEKQQPEAHAREVKKPPPVKKPVKPKKPTKKKVKSSKKKAADYQPLPRIIGPGGITKDDAVAIALENAPPALSVQALPRVYQDQPVFMVVFRTESGSRQVMVDRRNGKIIPGP